MTAHAVYCRTCFFSGIIAERQKTMRRSSQTPRGCEMSIDVSKNGILARYGDSMLDMTDTNVRQCSTLDEYHARGCRTFVQLSLSDQFDCCMIVPSIAVARPHAPGSIFSTQGEACGAYSKGRARQSPGPSALSSSCSSLFLPASLAMCVPSL
jgi:hypothetical protein